MAETNILNLPTHEQVTEIKNAVQNVEATGGQVLDVFDKKYKAVMVEHIKLKVGYGERYLDPLQQSYEHKYPTLPKYDIRMMRRIHLWNNIHMIQTSKFIAFIDMNILEVIHAEEINNPNFFGGVGGNWFADSKYLYVRGTTASSGNVCYAVMDKTTFKYVTVIRQIGGSSFGTNDSLSGDIVCQGSYFFVTSSVYNYMWVFQLAFDGLGVPMNFTYVVTGGWSGGDTQCKAFFGDEKFLYVMYTNHTSLYTIEKKQFLPSTKTFLHVAGNSMTGSAPGGVSQWNYKYIENSKNFILLSFGSSNNANIYVMNIDTLALHQQLATNQADSFLTFDYQTGKQIYTQPYTVAGFEINGNGYDSLLYYIREGETWKLTQYYVPASKTLNSTSLGRQYTLGAYAYIKDGDVYLKANSRLFAKLGDANIISHYKEVID